MWGWEEFTIWFLSSWNLWPWRTNDNENEKFVHFSFSLFLNCIGYKYIFWCMQPILWYFRAMFIYIAQKIKNKTEVKVTSSKMHPYWWPCQDCCSGYVYIIRIINSDALYFDIMRLGLPFLLNNLLYYIIYKFKYRKACLCLP